MNIHKKYNTKNKNNGLKLKLESKLVKYNKIKNKETRLICKKMSILLGTGYDITKILNIIMQQSNQTTSKVLFEISNHIGNGNSITQSFKKTNKFSSFFISMLLAGETSGNLDNVMEDLANYYDKEEKIRSKVISVSMYPIIIIILSICTMIFMLLFVIPNFQMVFMDNNINPPILTEILIKMSIFTRKYFLFIMLGIIVSILVIYYLVKSNRKIRYLKEAVKLKLPIVKDVIQLIITVRFCRTLSILVQSGVNIVESIEISSKVIDNDIVYKRLQITNDYIKKGHNIGYSIEMSNVFPKDFISLIKVGEESGNLDATLNITNDYYTERLNSTIEKLMRFIEPMLTIIIGILVGLFIISMVMPIFDAMNAM